MIKRLRLENFQDVPKIRKQAQLERAFHASSSVCYDLTNARPLVQSLDP